MAVRPVDPICAALSKAQRRSSEMTVPFTGRREDPRLLTGTGRFTADWSLPGQLHAAFLRSDHAHAAIISLDASAALAAPAWRRC